MASAFFMTRGKDDEVETLRKWLSTAVLPMPITKADGTVIDSFMECQVRPIQLWEFIYPRGCQDIVTNSLGLYHEGNMFVSGYNINPKLWALRKLLGANEFTKPKDIEVIDDKGVKIKVPCQKMPVPYERWKNVNIIGIGYRDDGDIFEYKHERI